MRAAAAWLLVCAGCGPSGSTVLVSVTAPGSLSAARLSATATLAGMSRGPFDVQLAVPGFPPSHSFAIEVAPELSGVMAVHVVALDAGNRAIATGDGSAEVVPGEEVVLTIVLGAPMADGGVDGPLADGGPADAAGDLATTCLVHADCATLVCRPDHQCAMPKDVSYVDNREMSPAGCLAGGPGTGTIGDPFCEIPTALDANTSFVHVAGSKVAYAPLNATDNKWNGKQVIGPGRGATELATVASDGSLGADAVQFSLTNMVFDGMDFLGQLNCETAGTIQLHDVSVHDSTADGIYVGACTLVFQGGSITSTPFSGVRTNTVSANVVLSDVTFQKTATSGSGPNTEPLPASVYLAGGGDVQVDRCFIGPGNGVALFVGDGTYSVTNTFIVDNVGPFAMIIGTATGTFQFNTVANNQRAVNRSNSVITSLEASIFTGNEKMGSEFNDSVACPLVNGTTSSAGPTQPLFVNAAQEDYRLDPTANDNTVCCIDQVHGAVDGGAATLSNHDYFGTMRPQSKGWDVGAHEAQ